MEEKNGLVTTLIDRIRTIVFGLGDGLVSTLGAVTGIAGTTFDNKIVMIAGFVVVAVEALSMSVGEYLSSKSEKEVWVKQMRETKEALIADRDQAHATLDAVYKERGFSDAERVTVMGIVTQHEDWMLKEIAVHRHDLSPVQPESPLGGAVFMLFSYALGGLVPLSPYLFLDVREAFAPSIIATALALFTVGAIKGSITTKRWIVSGLEMAVLSLIAAGVGVVVGRFVDSLL